MICSTRSTMRPSHSAHRSLPSKGAHAREEKTRFGDEMILSKAESQQAQGCSEWVTRVGGVVEEGQSTVGMSRRRGWNTEKIGGDVLKRLVWKSICFKETSAKKRAKVVDFENMLR